MKEEFQNKKILFAVLNWGIGHASRSSAWIQKAINENAQVCIASSGQALLFLRERFPELEYLELPDYNIRYQKKGPLWLVLIPQIPGILKQIKREYSVVQAWLKNNPTDLIVSDNCPGVHDKSIPSIYITHQLQIMGPRLLKPFLKHIHFYFIKRFNECWVPDTAISPGLGGELSHVKTPFPLTYIGTSSHLIDINEAALAGIDNIPDYLILLSGPEPQREILEQLISEKLKQSNKSILLCKGIAGSNQTIEKTGSSIIVSFLKPEQIVYYASRAKIVVSRSGYSSIMDWQAIQAKALLIPTPGQTEQEYLAKMLLQSGQFYSESQKDIDIIQALERAENFYLKHNKKGSN